MEDNLVSIGELDVLDGIISKQHFLRIARLSGWIIKIKGRAFVEKSFLDNFIKERALLEERTKVFFTCLDLSQAMGVGLPTVREWVKAGLVKAKMFKYQYYIEPKEFNRVVGMRTLNQLAKELGVSKKAIQGAIESRKIRTLLFGKWPKIPKEEVERVKKLFQEGKIFQIAKRKVERRVLNAMAQNSNAIFNEKEFGSSFDALPFDKKKNLILLAKKGDEKAINLLLKFFRVVVEVEASNFARAFGQRAEINELTQYGLFGIMQAIENYPNFEVDFVGYVRVYIRWTIRKNFYKDITELVPL